MPNTSTLAVSFSGLRGDAWRERDEVTSRRPHHNKHSRPRLLFDPGVQNRWAQVKILKGCQSVRHLDHGAMVYFASVGAPRSTSPPAASGRQANTRPY